MSISASIPKHSNARGSSQAHTALTGIYEISKVLTRPERLEIAFSTVINLLSGFLDMNDGLIALLGDNGEPTLVVGAGWSDATAREHFERLPEQAVGQIVVSGMPLVVPDITHSPYFADWTEPENREPRSARAFVGVPIQNAETTIGTITILRQAPLEDSASLDEDARFLKMVANLLGQTVALQTLIQRDRERLMEEGRRIQSAVDTPGEKKSPNIAGIVGESAAIRRVVEKIQQVARCNLPVLLCGESGTGKELFARAIHEFSPRKDKPCIKVNCAALSETVLESELFGHERGAFTGAVEMRKGRFELAHGGMLFLDEIGEVSPAFQAKLLRVLQEGEFERVGGTRTIKVDVRLVTATNRNLEEMVLTGQFRSDLYYRISVVPVHLPPLRERRDDVPLLAAVFLKRFNREHGVSLAFSKEAMSILHACDFPGNVRELESCVRRTAAMAKDSTLRVEDFSCKNGGCLSLVLGKSLSAKRAQSRFPMLDPAANQTSPSAPAPETAASFAHDERQKLIDAMERSGWVQAKAARLLGLTPRQMGYALRKHAIEVKRF